MCWACCGRRNCWPRISTTGCRNGFHGWRISGSRKARKRLLRSGRARCCARRHGAGDSEVSSGCAGRALFGDGTRWTRASSSLEHSGEGGVPGGGRSEAVSGADCGGIGALAGEEVLYRKRVLVRRDDLPRCGLDLEAEHRRAERGTGHVVCAVRDAGLATSDVAGGGELDRGSGGQVYILPAGGFGGASDGGQGWAREGFLRRN